MFYVYILASTVAADRFYVGLTGDLKTRLLEHNAGRVASTPADRPWKIKNYIAFVNRDQAAAFEAYLKTGSGRAFAKRHF